MTTHLQQYNDLFTTTQLQQFNNLFTTTQLQHYNNLFTTTHLQQHSGELLACTLQKLWLSLISQLVKSVCTLAHFGCCYHHVKTFQKQHVTVSESTGIEKIVQSSYTSFMDIVGLYFADLSIVENNSKELF